MTRVPAPPRGRAAAQEDITPLEYGLVAAFVLMALAVAVPGVPIALRSAAQLVLDRLG